METRSAIELVNALTYRPGWTIEASDYTNRFEGSIMVKFTFPAYHTEREHARNGYPSHTDSSWAQFPVIVADCETDADLYFKILQEITKLEQHEAREFLRVEPTMWAPFHPHRVDGMKRWAEKNGTDVGCDFRYGVA